MRHLSVGYAEPLRSELLSFVNAIRSGRTPAVTGEEAVASLEVAIRCLDARAASSTVPQRKGPRTGMTVSHPKYGIGTVVRREGEGDDAKITVNFPGIGLKKLVEKYAGLKRN